MASTRVSRMQGWSNPSALPPVGSNRIARRGLFAVTVIKQGTRIPHIGTNIPKDESALFYLELYGVCS